MHLLQSGGRAGGCGVLGDRGCDAWGFDCSAKNLREVTDLRRSDDLNTLAAGALRAREGGARIARGWRAGVACAGALRAQRIASGLGGDFQSQEFPRAEAN